MAVALVACGGGRDEPPPSPRAGPIGVGGALDPSIPNGNELYVHSDGGVTEPLRRAVETALVHALKTARPCMEGIYGTVFAEIDFDAAGRPTRAHIRSPLLEGSPIAKCMEKELATMSIGKADGPVRVTYPVRNVPSAEQVKEAADIVKRAL
jgi:hypothetical protein